MANHPITSKDVEDAIKLLEARGFMDNVHLQGCIATLEAIMLAVDRNDGKAKIP